MNPDKIRNVLNILFMILGSGSYHRATSLARDDFKLFIIRYAARQYSSSSWSFLYGSPTDKEK